MIARGQYGTTPQQVAKTREHDFHFHMAPSFNPELVSLLKQEKEYLLINGFIKNDFDIDSWIDSSFLEKALKEY